MRSMITNQVSTQLLYDWFSLQNSYSRLSEEKNYLCFYLKKMLENLDPAWSCISQPEEIFLLLNNFNSCKEVTVIFDLSVKLVFVVNKT